MPIQRTFHLILAPDYELEVGAPDVATAIAVARDALPFLQEASTATTLAASPSEDYILTCLVCGVVNPQRAGKSLLVAMQEHQIGEHALAVTDFRQAVRVSHHRGDHSCHVWGFPPALAEALQLDHLSFMRATKSTVLLSIRAEEDALPDGFTMLVCIHACAPAQHEVCIVGEDKNAWYGYPRSTVRVGDPLVYPKSEWELCEAAVSLR